MSSFEPRQEPFAYDLTTCEASADALGPVIRGHWGIENRLHHVLDISLGEDGSRIRRNPGIFAQPRHFALNLLRHNGQTNIHRALYNNAMSLDRVLNYRGINLSIEQPCLGHEGIQSFLDSLSFQGCSMLKN